MTKIINSCVLELFEDELGFCLSSNTFLTEKAAKKYEFVFLWKNRNTSHSVNLVCFFYDVFLIVHACVPNHFSCV